MTRILTLDVSLPHESTRYAEFGAPLSLFEFDIVIWDPVNTFSSYTYDALDTYAGAPMLSRQRADTLIADIKRRNRELHRLLELGRMLVVFSTPNLICYGRSRSKIEKIDLLAALPYAYGAEEAGGSSVSSTNPEFSGLLRNSSAHWTYRAAIEEHPGAALAHVENSDIVVGFTAKFQAGGTAVHLPDLNYVYEDDAAPADGADDSIAEDEEEDALERKRLSVAEMAHLEALLLWLASFSKPFEKSDPAPDWVAELAFHEEKDVVNELEQVRADQARLMERESALTESLAREAEWKRLIHSTGEQLEVQVQRAFELFGFEPLDDEKENRRDLRMKRGDNFIVVEVKGVSKSAAEKNAAQLEKWAAEALASTGYHISLF